MNRLQEDVKRRMCRLRHIQNRESNSMHLRNDDGSLMLCHYKKLFNK